jgi:hypothetical protein
MDLSSFFATDVIRYVATYLVPSIWAVYPLYFFLNKIGLPAEIGAKNDFVFGGIAVSIVIAVGFIIENIAIKIEEANDRRSSQSYDEFKSIWKRYLLLEVKEDIPMKDYLKSIVLRLKFKNSFIVASSFNLIGAFMLTCAYHEKWPFALIYFALYSVPVIASAAFIDAESFEYTKLLNELRINLLEKYEVRKEARSSATVQESTHG